ncbi:hypothetical protein PVAP13_2KG347730 [Panicum virgatum]|uniref:Uncharacterized protein n=1 Tax=Panicum virgatum TaxID=38727 RepID=A0A8T0W321_PANVG|nr:hypothetical protein PVAP13_2KG347730 [Panicum virgatum]KAG2643630.1 hypothetical protein PVAP13_2KG347730 [Panicum virgatum]KAG2643631.1 hypothetical protein PVAP13_2KG347730 [Panicum virgatum]
MSIISGLTKPTYAPVSECLTLLQSSNCEYVEHTCPPHHNPPTCSCFLKVHPQPLLSYVLFVRCFVWRALSLSAKNRYKVLPLRLAICIVFTLHSQRVHCDINGEKFRIGPLFSQLMPMMEASPVYSLARYASGDAWKALFDLAGGFIREYDQEAMVSLSKFVDQLPSVMNQVREGVSEFKPTPPENREFCKNSYSVPNTLLVKFSVDAIDDTDIVEDVLRPRVDSIGGQIKKVILSGTHLTPCIQDVKWQVGSEYTPADAVAQGLKSLALNETRVLSRTIADWLRSL